MQTGIDFWPEIHLRVPLTTSDDSWLSAIVLGLRVFVVRVREIFSYYFNLSRINSITL
jgi:hypothetical protein